MNNFPYKEAEIRKREASCPELKYKLQTLAKEIAIELLITNTGDILFDDNRDQYLCDCDSFKKMCLWYLGIEEKDLR
jgi:hypothetical protein